MGPLGLYKLAEENRALLEKVAQLPDHKLEKLAAQLGMTKEAFKGRILRALGGLFGGGRTAAGGGGGLFARLKNLFTGRSAQKMPSIEEILRTPAPRMGFRAPPPTTRRPVILPRPGQTMQPPPLPTMPRPTRAYAPPLPVTRGGGLSEALRAASGAPTGATRGGALSAALQTGYGTGAGAGAGTPWPLSKKLKWGAGLGGGGLLAYSMLGGGQEAPQQYYGGGLGTPLYEGPYGYVQ